MSRKHVILDCDGGSDDAWALIFLLKAHENGLINLLGVTISGNGNTDLKNAATNMFRILKACNQINIPLYLGATESILIRAEFPKERMFNGVDGFSDILPPDERIHLERDAHETHAVIAIKEYIEKYPKQVTVICVGPCTNLALCYSMFGIEFSKKIRELFIMGGNIRGVGNVSRSAEFNFYADPEAANAVLSKSKCPITLLPWETCRAEADKLSFKWRMTNFGYSSDKTHPVLEILNTVEAKQFGSRTYWNPCDAFAVGVYLFGDKLVRKRSLWHAGVDLKGEYTRGQMVLDHLHDVKSNPKNVTIIEELNEEFFKKIVTWSVGYLEILES